MLYTPCDPERVFLRVLTNHLIGHPSSDDMILPYSLTLLFLTFFCACSTLKFSQFGKGSSPKGDIKSYIQMKDDTQIQLASTHELGAKVALSLEDDRLNALGTNFFICIYRDKKLSGCYKDDKVENLQLVSGDVLIFGRKANAEDIQMSLLAFFPPEKESNITEDLIAKLVPVFMSIEFFVASVKEDANLPLKFSQFERGDRYNSNETKSHVKVKEDRRFQLVATHPSGTNMTLSLKNGRLSVPKTNSFICIYRDREISHFYQGVEVKDVQLTSGDVLIFGEESGATYTLPDLRNATPPENSSKIVEYFSKECVSKYSNIEFFVLAVREEDKTEKIAADLPLKFSRDARGDCYSAGIKDHLKTREDMKLQIAPTQPGTIDMTLSLKDSRLDALGTGYFVCIYRNRELSHFYLDPNVQNVQLASGDILILGREPTARFILPALRTASPPPPERISERFDFFRKNLVSMYADLQFFVISIDK